MNLFDSLKDITDLSNVFAAKLLIKRNEEDEGKFIRLSPNNNGRCISLFKKVLDKDYSTPIIEGTIVLTNSIMLKPKVTESQVTWEQIKIPEPIIPLLMDLIIN